MYQPLRVAIIGMGGFAGKHQRSVKKLEEEGELRLICTCDPCPENFTEKQEEWEYIRRGVRVFNDYLEMLNACASELDMVTIPTPIHLHARMHQACVERGLAVYLEKPPTVDWKELEGMIETDSHSVFQTMVGFNFIVDPPRRLLKERLVKGDFGNVRQVAAYGMGPRSPVYYQRASWAGRLMMDDQLVLDSCISNAMGHVVHNALFWCGAEGLDRWGEPAETEAEIYRAHSIQNGDTFFTRSRMKDNIELRIGMTHACSGRSRQEEWVVCEDAVIRYHVQNSVPGDPAYIIQWNNGHQDVGEPSKHDWVVENMRTYGQYLRKQRERPLTTLADCRPFVRLNNLVYLAAGRINDIPAEFIRQDEQGFVEVAELCESTVDLAATGRLPSEQGRPWAVAGGGKAEVEDLHELRKVIQNMLTSPR